MDRCPILDVDDGLNDLERFHRGGDGPQNNGLRQGDKGRIEYLVMRSGRYRTSESADDRKQREG